MGGRDWVGINTKDAIIISAHLARPTKHSNDVDRGHRLMEDIATVLNKITAEELDISIVIAIDTNTTLRIGYRGQTGEATMNPKKGHTPETYNPLHELMEQYKLFYAGHKKVNKIIDLPPP